MPNVQYLRPSGASVWTKCLGYVAMVAAYPSDADCEADNEVREDGTACHWLAQQYLQHNLTPEVDSLSPNNRIITREMYEAVAMYARELLSWPSFVIEHTIDCGRIYPGMSGTPDAHCIDYVNKVLYVGDLKYGFRFVDAYQNLQLLIYAICLFDFYGVVPTPEWRVRLTIVQPRNWHPEGHVRSWEFTADGLLGWTLHFIHAAREAMSPNALRKVNPGCIDCPGRHACPEYMQACSAAMELAGQSVPFELSPDAIAAELGRLEYAKNAIEGRITGLTTQAEVLLREGKVVPGYTMASKAGNLRWTAEGLQLVRACFPNALKEPDAITPTQAMERGLVPETLVQQFSARTPGQMKLVRQDARSASRKFNRGK